MLRDAIGQTHQPWMGVPRIVSLVPSLTELVCELGLAPQLVGRTGFCVHPRALLRQVARVGGTKDVRLDKIRALAPTHVIVNVDENRRETVTALQDFVPHVIVTHPTRPADNLELFHLFGAIFQRPAQARGLAERFTEAMSRLAAAARQQQREHVLYLIWKDPWMTVSRDTYIAAMLAAAGWDSLPATAPRRYPKPA
jgi:ABC-type Fe3+-hydroxamate transport system substrate-binding protein